MTQSQYGKSSEPKQAPRLWLVVVLIAVILGGLIALYFYWQNFNKTVADSSIVASQSPAVAVSTSPSPLPSPTPSPVDSAAQIQIAQDFYTWYLALVNNGGTKRFETTNPNKLVSDFSKYLTSDEITNLNKIFNDPYAKYDPIVCAQDLPQSIEYTSQGTDTIVADMKFGNVSKVTLKFSGGKISEINCPKL